VAVVILAGVVLVAAPWVLKAWRDAMAKTSALAVQTERAEIAAHLHDSVLQTLALIQKNADTPTTVVRLARAQERDLRQYLYQDPSRPTGTLTDRLEDLAAAIEDDHGQPIEVVTVGSATGPWLDPVLQATREAMLNGVRHAGPVQVYAEGRPDAVEVFVKDRGPGFDLATIPPDRLGIRESVVGRMERAGGTARIITGDGGTEVRLHLPVPEENGKNGEEGRQA
jgi:signal transduction histidine kinase